MPERPRLDHGEWVPQRRLVIALVFALILAFLGTNVAQAQTPNASAAYEVDADIVGKNPDSARLCTGERVDIHVWIRRLVYDDGPVPAVNPVGGGRVVSEIRDRKVGHFETYGPNRQGVSEPEAPRYALAVAVGPVGNTPGAQYRFVADAPGTTKIDFHVSATGEEPFGENWPKRSDTVEITVVDCFEAYTSGLGLTFPVADMKDLILPFTLESVSELATGAGTISTKANNMFFLPSGNRQSFVPSTSGLFVLAVFEVFQFGDKPVNCIDVVTGRYDVEFHIKSDNPMFRSGIDVGNLRLWGTGTRWCDGFHVGTVSWLDPAKPGWLVAFKPKLVPPPFVPESR